MDLLKLVSRELIVHCLAVEFPGYGVYEGQATAERVIEDAERVLDFV